MLETLVLLVVAGAFVLVCVALVVHEWRNVGPKLRLLKAARPRSTRDAVDGFVRLEGKARGDAHTTSPVYERPCFAWSVRVERWAPAGRSGSWVLLHSRSEAVPFEVEDDDGRARVEASADAVLDLRDEPILRQSLREKLPPHAISYLQRLSIEAADYPKGLQIVEGRLEQGEPCTVFGEVRRESSVSSTETGYREASTRAVVSAGEVQLHLVDLRAAVWRNRMLRRALSITVACTAVALVIVLGTIDQLVR